MNRRHLYFWFLVSTAFLPASVAYSDGAPSPDYSQAVSLFNAKDFQAALPLFQQITQDDPTNAMAYYYLGSCQETVGYLRGEVLNYYISNKLSPDAQMKAYADKKFDQLSPEDQDWVEKHLDAFSKPAPTVPAAETEASGPSNGHYSQGVAFYESGDYQTALPLLQKAVRELPENAMAYYYLGKCEKMLGDTREAVLNFYISNQLVPYPALKVYADKLMEKLPADDQKSVNDQLAAWQNPGPNLGLSSAPAAAQSSRFGIRVAAGLPLFSLSDFQTDVNSVKTNVQGYAAANPSYGYNFQSSVPSSSLAFGVNPYFSLDSDFEIGLAFNYWPTATVSYAITAGAIPQYFVRSTWEINTFEVLLKARYYFPKPVANRGLRFFVEPSLGLQPISLGWTDSYQNTVLNPSTDQTGWNVSSTAFEGGLQLGAVVTSLPNFLFSFSMGYLLSAASGFQGTAKDVNVPAINGAAGNLYMFKDPSTGESYITFIPSDSSLLSAFGENSATITACSPFSVDLSGLRFALDASYTY